MNSRIFSARQNNKADLTLATRVGRLTRFKLKKCLRGLSERENCPRDRRDNVISLKARATSALRKTIIGSMLRAIEGVKGAKKKRERERICAVRL